jgi:putative flippase GtrA
MIHNGFGRSTLKSGDSLDTQVNALQPGPENPHWLMKFRLIAWLAGHFPPGLFLRYLLVGVWNTVVGFSIYALITYYLTKTHLPAAYMYSVAPSCFINITMAFFLYKWFVFRTKGNYWREYRRTMAVYWSLFIPAMLILPVLVNLLRWLFHMGAAAPYVANALLTVVGVIYNFLGYKKYSFKQIVVASPDASAIKTDPTRS